MGAVTDSSFTTEDKVIFQDLRRKMQKKNIFLYFAIGLLSIVQALPMDDDGWTVKGKKPDQLANEKKAWRNNPENYERTEKGLVFKKYKTQGDQLVEDGETIAQYWTPNFYENHVQWDIPNHFKPIRAAETNTLLTFDQL